MSNPYRDCLVELYDWAKRTSSHYYVAPDVLDRTRILLDQPEPPELTDEEIDDWCGECADLTRAGKAGHYWVFGDVQSSDIDAIVRAAVARWGCPTPQSESAEPEPPLPISAHDLSIQWNQQADADDQWDSLDLYEQLAWAQARAIAADRARALLDQPEPPELTDQEIANAARKALDSYRYSTELPYFLEEHASEHEPIMLAFRAAIAADRARRTP